MRIEVAAETGFCFGVKRALRILEEAAQRYPEVETLGPVVHNQRVVDSLRQLGIKTVENPNVIVGKVAVVPSHGMPPYVSDGLAAKGVTIIDTTCPNVQKAQVAARGLSDAGFWVIVFGDPEHPEVKGIIGWAGGNGVATLDSSTIAGLGELPRRVGLLSQTTRTPAQFAQFTNSFVAAYLPPIEELRVINTLCNVTKKRQEEAIELARRVDVMVVVGGRNSANTRCLAEVCTSVGTETHHIEAAEEIEERWLQGRGSVGLTTGTSIPDQLTQEVTLKLKDIIKGLEPR